ncbi:14-3-3 protein [Cryphonectria parasitica EP155]|uniref:14-3-3 protein n=1 Tax=Cryphonectria parasitica (strain ATCC 38755 / EP155) TaxID=660469 RepID=A0A9P5CUX1_CRYP1|nr:14-3-3 protein [Cryphonectria parasitica EP155]KAF3770706.1 14-3-3 protein [Cryphonectria parasitica EP155]
MASSVVDRKFLGKLAKEVEPENPLLSSILYKLLGLSHQLSDLLVKARKQRKLGLENANDGPQTLYNHILWLAREGLVMLEQYVLPMVANSGVLKVLAYKLRASLYHVVVLFHNQPPVSARYISSPDSTPSRLDKGKGIARDDDFFEASPAMQQRSPYEGGPVAPPPGFGPEPPGAFLLPVGDYLPTAHRHFRDALTLADKHLWGSHSLRLSIKTEYSAFLYECAHDEEASRKLARKTINEVYEATEGIDNDMFQDACELVTVLGRMMKRGQPPSNRSKASSPGTVIGAQQQAEPSSAREVEAEVQDEPSPVPQAEMPSSVMPPPASEAQPGFI